MEAATKQSFVWSPKINFGGDHNGMLRWWKKEKKEIIYFIFFNFDVSEI
jgi:hypothetical protein